MSKKDVTGDRNDAPFTPEIANRIIEKTRVPKANQDLDMLLDDLNEAAEVYQILGILDKDKTLKQKIDQLSDVVNHASRLVTSIDEITYDTRVHLYQVSKVTPVEARSTVREARENAKVLAQWAKAACKALDTLVEITTQQKSKNEPSAKTWLVAIELPKLYEKHFGQPWGYSQPAIDKGLPGSPGMRFSCACLEVMGIDMNRGAIAKSRKRYMGDKAT